MDQPQPYRSPLGEGDSPQDGERFWEAGRRDVAAVFHRLGTVGVVVQPGRALDFGCGAGRHTQALAERFAQCDGVDISAAAVAQAAKLNRRGERCRFHRSETSDLRMFDDGSFDFVLSLMALELMAPPRIQQYLREFMRVLEPGGIAFFNLPVRYRFGTELPPSAKWARVEIVEFPGPLSGRQSHSVKVRVHNASSVVWPKSAQVLVGNHWWTPDGRLLVLDDGRSPLGRELEPGGAIEVMLDVTPPEPSGEYELEVDLLQEHLGWFAEAGSDTARATLEVHPPAVHSDVEGSAATRGPGSAMSLHMMAEADVLAEVERAGGVVFDAASCRRHGPSVESLDYVVAKSISRRLTGNPASTAPEISIQDELLQDRLYDALDTGRAERVSEQLAEFSRLRAATADAATEVEKVRQALARRGELLGFSITSDRGAGSGASVFVRRVLRRLMLQVLHRQTEFNRGVQRLFETVTQELAFASRLTEIQRDSLARAEDRIEALERSRHQARAEAAALAAECARGELRYTMLRRSLSSRSEADAAGPAGRDAAIDYLGLTDRFRGSRAEIRERQRGYVEHFVGTTDVLDIGCGRGEFLELLSERGVGATGVDLDERMVSECRRMGFEAVLEDGLTFLEQSAAESRGGIFAAQVIEHLATDDLLALLRLSFSRLRPGGVLVLETVNPTCLLTFSSFYVDPTHTRPVHPETLRWLAESAGFSSEIDFVSPVPAARKLRPLATASIADDAAADFNRGIEYANQLLFGHQEYALVARKPLPA